MGGTVSVLIVDFYTRELSLDLARDLEDDDSVGEVLIVDNTGDSQYQAGWLEQGKMRVVRSPTRAGYGSGLNRGAREVTKSAYLLLANSDLRVASGTVGSLVEGLESRNLGAVGPVILGESGHTQADSAGRFPDIRTRGDGPDWITGACILTSKDLFDELGGFDERFDMYWEDVDFCRRLHERGLRVSIDDGLIVRHQSGASIATASARYARARTGRQTYLAKWARSSPRRLVTGVTSACKLCALRIAEAARRRTTG